MSTDPRAASISPTPEEAKKRRESALVTLAVPLVLTVAQLLFWHDWSSLFKYWVVFGAVASYWLWLSTRFSARFEASIKENALTGVPVAFLGGALVALLFLT